jgi:AcrR family transcriptional regulator
VRDIGRPAAGCDTGRMQTESLRTKHREETKSALVAAARKLFAERGYHNVGIREFAAEAGVTRGALYHHFGDKESLFLAVYDSIQRDLMAEAARRHREPTRPDHWTQLRRDLQIALDDMRQPDIQQIKLIDAPAILGWVRWRELETQYGLGAITKAVENAIREKLIDPHPVRPLALLISASFNEAALFIAHSKTPDAARAEAGEALDAVLAGLQRR